MVHINVEERNGRLLLSTIVYDRYVWRVYDGYSRSEATRRFREYLHCIRVEEEKEKVTQPILG